jgi:hypothetical protein
MPEIQKGSFLSSREPSRENRVKLIDGEIIDLNTIGSPHATLTNRLARNFTRAVPDELALVHVQSPLRLDAFNEPEPASCCYGRALTRTG